LYRKFITNIWITEAKIGRTTRGFLAVELKERFKGCLVAPFVLPGLKYFSFLFSNRSPLSERYKSTEWSQKNSLLIFLSQLKLFGSSISHWYFNSSHSSVFTGISSDLPGPQNRVGRRIDMP
jgi:hypothetical protein